MLNFSTHSQMTVKQQNFISKQILSFSSIVISSHNFIQMTYSSRYATKILVASKKAVLFAKITVGSYDLNPCKSISTEAIQNGYLSLF